MVQAQAGRIARARRLLLLAAPAALAAAVLTAAGCGYPEGARREAHYRLLQDRLLFERAEAAYGAGDYASAAAYFADCLRRSRSFRRDDAAFRLADSLLGLEQYAEAAGAYARAAKIHPGSVRAPEAWIRAGVILERLGRNDAAADAYQALVEFHPASAEAASALERLAALAPPPVEGTVTETETLRTTYPHAVLPSILDRLGRIRQGPDTWVSPRRAEGGPPAPTTYPSPPTEPLIDRLWPGPPFHPTAGAAGR